MMSVIIDPNFIMAVCAVFTLMIMIFGGFFTFVIMPVVKQNTMAINNLASQLGEKIGIINDGMHDHGKRISEQEKMSAVIESRLTDHIEREG